MIDVKHLRHIVAIADAGSFGRAAEAIGLTQSALSRSIQAIEEAYGFRLFDRGRRGASMTPAGMAVIEEAKRFLRDMKSLDDDFRQLGMGIAGTVRVGVDPFVASAALPFVLIDILQNYSDISLEVTIDSSLELLRLVNLGEIDFGFFSSQLAAHSRDIKAQFVRKVPLSILVRAGHPLAGKLVTKEMIDDFPVVGGFVPNSMRSNFCAPDISCKNYEILKNATLRTDAVWFSSPLLCREELKNGKLGIVDCSDYIDPSYDIVFATRSRTTQSPTQRRVSELFIQALSSEISEKMV